MLLSSFCFALNFTVLYVLSITIARFCKFPILYSFIIATSATTLLYYLSTLFYMLFYAKILIYCFCVASCIYFLFSRKKFYILNNKNKLLFISLICISIIFANSYILGKDYTLFWATFTKYIHINSSFWNNTICGSQHSSYTPGFAILSTVSNGLFEYLPESQYFSCIIPLIFLSCAVVQALPEYKHWSLNFLAVFFSLFAIKTLGCVNPVNFLNVDYAISALFATALLIAILEKNLRLSRAVLLFILPVLTLLKITCLPMSLVAISIYGIRCFFEKKSFKFAIFQSVFLLSICLFTFISWMVNLEIRGIHDSAFVFSAEKLYNMLYIYSSNINNITSDLLDYIFIKPCIIVPKQISFFVSSFSLLIMTIFLYYKAKSIKYLFYMFILVCSFFLWLILHLYIIAVILPDASRVDIMSYTYPRYIGPFICAIFLTGAFSYLRENHIYKKISILYSKILCIIIISLLPIFVCFVYIRAHPEFGNDIFNY